MTDNPVIWAHGSLVRREVGRASNAAQDLETPGTVLSIELDEQWRVIVAVGALGPEDLHDHGNL